MPIRLHRLAVLLPCLVFFGGTAHPDTPTPAEADWQALRKSDPYHIQGIAVGEPLNGRQTLIVAEPPPGVTLEGLRRVDPDVFGSAAVMKQRIGYDGWAAVYQNELAIRWKEIGYELTQGRNHASDIKGFTKEYLDAESQRSQLIKLEEQARGVEGPEAKERIAHAVRENKLKRTPEEVHRAHREHQELFGSQADKLHSEALSRQAKRLNPEQAQTQAKRSLDFATNKLSERTAVFEQWEVYREALRHGQGKVTLEQLKDEVERRETQNLLHRVDHVRQYAPGKRYTTPETLAQEQEVLERVAAGKDTHKELETWTAEDVSKHYPKLNKAQAQTVADILGSKDRFTGLQGMAGVGKTTALKAIKVSGAARVRSGRLSCYERGCEGDAAVRAECEDAATPPAPG
jgi:flagellar biosynthesis GTPase FlhF